MLKVDLCIIGAGSGGLSVAAAARAFGASVVLIEEGEMGGDCLNTGCVPSKALLAAGKHAAAMRDAGRFGVTAGDISVNFGRVHEHVHGVIASIAPHDSVERFEALGVKVIKSHGIFTSPKLVEAGGEIIAARRFVIAAGSRAAVPPIPGLDQVTYFTNETIFDLRRKPSHLIVVGGGPIGIEMAQAHRRLGSKVTVVEALDALHRDDPELTAIALKALVEEGVTIHAQARVTSVAPKGQGVSVALETKNGMETLAGSHLLIAVGRKPSVDGLGLEAAHIRYDRRGIEVDAGLRTSNRRVYAIGDIAGGAQFTHVAGYHAGLVIRNALFGLPVRVDKDLIPWVTYTEPEIAHVGVSEAEAQRRFGRKFKIVRWSFADNDRARTERTTEGLVKLITSPKGRILGCGIVGPHAGELISLFSFAIANKLKVGSLTKFIAPYPTLAEIAKRVGVEYYRDQISNPWIGRWIRIIGLLP